MTLFMPDLTCQDAVELVTDYLDGRLTRRQRRRFERHLRRCGMCTRYLDQIRTTVRLAGHPVPEPLDEATRRDLLELYRRYRNAPPDPAG